MSQSSGTKEVIGHSPLHDVRFDILEELKKLPVQTGDIVFRLGNECYCGLPFSRLVAHLTKSKFSHASLMFLEGDDIYCLEINEKGTQQYRMLDWVDFSHKNGIAVYRIPNLSEEDRERIYDECKKFLELDLDYAFDFHNPNQTYCTKGCVTVLKNAGFDIFTPCTPKEVLKPHTFIFFLVINFIFGKLFGACVPIKHPSYIVGNCEIGMLASDKIEKIYEYNK